MPKLLADDRLVATNLNKALQKSIARLRIEAAG
jgi:hypothetical protein